MKAKVSETDFEKISFWGHIGEILQSHMTESEFCDPPFRGFCDPPKKGVVEFCDPPKKRVVEFCDPPPNL